ncbi:MAG: hypothetical protein IH612_00135 [Desulfofustis sp.]|nr:hypothetical protein [Desulfofustis sp.]
MPKNKEQNGNRKTYNKDAAIPGSGQQGKEQRQSFSEFSYQELMGTIPEESREETEAAFAALLGWIHSPEGTDQILAWLEEEEDIAAGIGKASLRAMDQADPDQTWSDSSKALAGFFGVKEISNILREAGLVDLSGEKEAEIFEVAAKNFILATIKSKPTPEEREAEALRIQKEVDPLLQGPLREKMLAAGEQKGYRPQGEEAQPQQQRGLLE